MCGAKVCPICCFWQMFLASQGVLSFSVSVRSFSFANFNVQRGHMFMTLTNKKKKNKKERKKCFYDSTLPLSSVLGTHSLCGFLFGENKRIKFLGRRTGRMSNARKCSPRKWMMRNGKGQHGVCQGWIFG